MSGGPVRVLVLQWAHEGGADVLAAVEDELTDLARRHGATVDRDRAVPLVAAGPDAPSPPDEVHTLRFPDADALEAFLADPARDPLRQRLTDALARTEVWRLDGMDEATRQRHA